MKNRLSVLLADDHAIVLEGLRHILEPEFEIVGTVADGRTLVAAVQNLRPDIVVLDISMPLLNGIQAAQLIRKANRAVILIFLTMHTDAAYAQEALEAGGSGYVLKASAGAELITAINHAARGRVFITPSIARSMLPLQRTACASADSPRLTARQREILRSIAQGRTAKEIAGLLNLSPRTVEFHKYRLMSELAVRTTAELVQFAIRHGVLAEALPRPQVFDPSAALGMTAA